MDCKYSIKNGDVWEFAIGGEKYEVINFDEENETIFAQKLNSSQCIYDILPTWLKWINEGRVRVVSESTDSSAKTASVGVCNQTKNKERTVETMCNETCNESCGMCECECDDLPEREISEGHLEQIIIGFVGQADYSQKLQILSLITNLLSYSE